jgi:hypothetical protein
MVERCQELELMGDLLSSNTLNRGVCCIVKVEQNKVPVIRLGVPSMPLKTIYSEKALWHVLKSGRFRLSE